jgi:hypothetical protein
MGLLTSLWDDEILERGETRRDGDELFRVKVVGSTPAGPTIQVSGILEYIFAERAVFWRDRHIKKFCLTQKWRWLLLIFSSSFIDFWN